LNILDLIFLFCKKLKNEYNDKDYKKVKNYFNNEITKQLQTTGFGYTSLYDFQDIAAELNIDELKTIDILKRLQSEGLISFSNTYVNGSPSYYKYKFIYLE